MSMKRTTAILALFTLATLRPAHAEPEAAHARVEKQQRLLSSLWAFATLNYLYCDVISLMDSNMLRQYSEGEVEGLTINEDLLLGATAFMQVPLSMVFLSTALPPRASRIANIAAGTIMTTAQTATLLWGKPTSYYLFSSVVEIATTSFITGYALFAMKPPPVVPSIDASRDSVTLRVGFRF